MLKYYGYVTGKHYYIITVRLHLLLNWLWYCAPSVRKINCRKLLENTWRYFLSSRIISVISVVYVITMRILLTDSPQKIQKFEEKIQCTVYKNDQRSVLITVAIKSKVYPIWWTDKRHLADSKNDITRLFYNI